MFRDRKSHVIVALFVACVWGGAAPADEIISFGFTDLVFQYDASSRLLQLDEQRGAFVHTDGNITRIVEPNAGATAVFDFSAPEIGSAGIDLDLTLGSLTNGVIPASGTLVFTDVNADQITANVEGIFLRTGFTPVVRFEGVLSDLVLPSNAFDGSGGSSIDISPSSFGAESFSGVAYLLQLEGGNDALAMFEQDIEAGTVATLDGGIVPEPATLLLLSCAALCFLRRNRAGRIDIIPNDPGRSPGRRLRI